MFNWIISFLIFMGICIGCGKKPEAVVLEPKDFQTAVKNDTNAVVLDVRTPEEYAAGHLKDAVNIDFLNRKTFDEAVGKLNPKMHYYVYCRSGRRSADAAKEMKGQGFKVTDMKGGYLAWESDSLPIVAPDAD